MNHAKETDFETVKEIFYLIFSVHYQMKRGIKNIYPS